jgi:predicted transposase/invertase (TIGR01784 family)
MDRRSLLAVGFFDPVMDNLARKRMYEEGLKEGKQEGLKEGEIKGLKEGEMKEKRQIARTMLARDMAILDIAAITGLSEEDIRKIT